MPTTALILPGLYSSGPGHWQTLWEQMDARCVRVEQDDWAAPRCADWVARLNEAIARTDGYVAFVAHSTACLLVAHWAMQSTDEQRARVRGALLVAPSDPEGPAYPAGPSGFTPVPLAPLPFPSIVVASTNDEYVTLDRATAYAAAWGSRLENVGAAGHLNGAIGLGVWPAGRAWLEEVRGGEPLAPPPYYHGTRAQLAPGDLIRPGFTSNYGRGKSAAWVYFAATLDAATWGAELARGETTARIYVVEPTGLFEHDPNLTNARFPGNPTRSYRTREPLRVIGEIVEWTPHAPELLDSMRAHIARLAEAGVEATEE